MDIVSELATAYECFITSHRHQETMSSSWFNYTQRRLDTLLLQAMTSHDITTQPYFFGKKMENVTAKSSSRWQTMDDSNLLPCKQVEHGTVTDVCIVATSIIKQLNPRWHHDNQHGSIL